MRSKYTLLLTCLSALYLSTLYSCADVQKTVYFNNQRDSSFRSNSEAPESVIRANDILSITVTSLNATATTIFNNPNNSYVTSTTAAGNSQASPGYLVNRAGNIQFPVLGELKVAGISTDDLRIHITQEILTRKLLVDPIVIVRQLNFKVTVLGEVGHPTVLNVPSEKISLLEALGLAGDVTIYGRKDNVMIIREAEGKKLIRHINLNSNELFNSQYYYLKSNDIVYVQSNKAKVASTSRGNYLLPVVFSALSFAAIIVQGFIHK